MILKISAGQLHVLHPLLAGLTIGKGGATENLRISCLESF